MAKECDPDIKIDSPSLSNRDKQKILLRRESQKMVPENKKMSTNDNLRQLSQRLIYKLCRIRFNSVSSNQEEQNPNDSCNNTSEEKENNPPDISTTIPTLSVTCNVSLDSQVDVKVISNDKPKLKGILKTTHKKLSLSNSIENSSNDQKDIQPNKSQSEPSLTTNNKEDSDSSTSSNSNDNDLNLASNSSKPIKQVTFNDKISRKRYKPQKSSVNDTKLSRRQQKKLKLLQRIDSLHSSHAINLLKSKDNESCESSEYESSDNED